jgi:hypothetical protein
VGLPDALLLAAAPDGDTEAQLEGGAEPEKLPVTEAELLQRALWLWQALAQELLLLLGLGLCQPEALLESVALWLLLRLTLGLSELQALLLREAAAELELL